MKAVDTGWKKEMDALVKRTSKNWENTGKNKKSSGLSASLNLGKARVRA
jgi:hypothetical protein